MAGAGSALWTFLPSTETTWRSSVRVGTTDSLSGADAVLGDDLADDEAGRGSDGGGLAETRAKARGGHQGALF